MANSKDILLTCYDGKILALVDSKKFKKQGIMANENIKPADAIDQKAADKEKSNRIAEMEKEVADLEAEVAKLEKETE